ncbi:interferon-inducible GTPase 5-like [Pristis pectinata]|uniref:interferon-inducible GTPase 5-like n=1 Tax=Pristis pectinata TaxID=685728 RepID=UPI00223E49C3|nr:interferon-inducible GTPase 5-like [Pristis pectinata]
MAAVSNESELQSLFGKGGIVAVVQRVKSDLDNVATTTIDIAVIGESGAGKSSFLNALGASVVKGRRASAAEKEGGMEPIRYQLPSDDAVSLWDLPAIQTRNFEAGAYLKSITLESYHCFIVLSSAPFEETAWQLAKEIQETKKKCYFVRNKIDCLLETVKQQEQSQYDENKALEYLRNTSTERSKKEGLESVHIFLISSFHRDKFDFEKLQQVLKVDLPALKRRVRLQVVENHVSSLIQKKTDAFLAEIWKIAVALASARAVSIPGAGVVCDIPLLFYYISSYRTSFGLDDETLNILASMFGNEIEELKAEIKSILAREFTLSSIAKELLQMAGEEIVESTVLQFVPLIGQGISASRSYNTITAYLKKVLQDLAEDSKRILKKVLQLDEGE